MFKDLFYAIQILGGDFLPKSLTRALKHESLPPTAGQPTAVGICNLLTLTAGLVHTALFSMRPLQHFLTRVPKKRATLLRTHLRYDTLVSARMLGDSKTRRGESGALYSFVTPLGTGTSSTPRRNLWVVFQDGKREREFIAKGPSKDDDKAQGWPAFQYEVKMQRLFNDEKMIRPMVDFLPSSDIDKPMMVLKPFEQTLWEARNARPMTTAEIKWIMEGVMLGIQTIHLRGLVHTGLL